MLSILTNPKMEVRMKIHLLALACMGALMGLPSLAQDTASEPGVTAPADIVAARRQVMATIGLQMVPVQDAMAGEEANLAELQSRTEAITGLLGGFPHLFPPATDTGAAEFDSDASPAIWQDFEAFTQFAHAAVAAADEATYAQDMESFLTAAATLDQACSDCHAQFLEYSMPNIGGGAGDADALKGLGF